MVSLVYGLADARVLANKWFQQWWNPVKLRWRRLVIKIVLSAVACEYTKYTFHVSALH